MDFAALMSKELDKSKKPTTTSASSSSSKYIKRADVEAKRRQDYLAEQARVEAEREAKAAAKRKREEDDAAENKIREEKRQKLAEESRRRREEREAEEERARRKRLGLPELVKAVSEDDDDAAVEQGMEDVPDGELAEKLRALGEPATLFGEAHGARLRRYRRLTTVVTKGPIPTTLQLVEEKDMKVDAAVPKDKDGRRWLFRQLASYFTMVLTEYEKAMEAERRDTTASKTAYSAMLFRKFEKYDLDDDLLAPIIEIVKAAQERRYVDANDGYLRLSIGKAAWPIGVTMVGIHERSAREKLHDGERGHVMGDEVTRKYLQSIKRLLTFAQVRWPPTDVRQLMG
ncbi:Prp18 domain-containing protein [Colletotrichum orchidophilum]|uniref:Pre-mRNA-splicing factor 18 n=1 Tax=Colletotrichum orchidophilum TaxID=1209926 RepID=A0A1G4AXM6_9PEZI|nr:Prp18 domain-containing protein [Colletotrichum orchidophilum]OHE93802.1 Prp18 domain-containing protein [Colletotrichum orchidophilum]